MTDTCNHGFARDTCLICRTLATGETTTTEVVVAPARRHDVAERTGQKRYRLMPTRAKPTHTEPVSGVRHRRSVAGSLTLVLMALLAVGAAVWILVGVVFTVLHVLELIAVGVGSGWVGYRIGHFRGTRHPR